MTRENKVALVVGFALVLFVGILISDHLSEAQNKKSADLAPPSPHPALPARAGARLVDLRRDLPQPASPREATPGTPPVEPAITLVAAPVAAAQTAPVHAHQVRPGESLSEICLRFYGDPALTGQLALYNGIDDPDALRAGARLRLPGHEVLRGDAAPAPETPASAPPVYATYRINPGDLLSGIARRFLHSADRWRQLYEINRDVLDDPDTIPAGTVIWIPSGATG